MTEHEQSPEIIKERIASLLELQIGSYQKAQLVLIVADLKPATELDIAPWNDPPEKVEEAIKKAGLAFIQKEPCKKDWTSYAVAARRQDAEALTGVSAKIDHLQYGRLMGYPESAIQAFRDGTLLPIDQEPDTPWNVIQMRLSQDHWREELEHLRRMNDALKTYAPDVYRELGGIDE